MPPDNIKLYDLFEELARTRRGWINLQPVIDPDDEVPEPGLIGGIFSTVGPALPVCTWFPGKNRSGTIEPDSVGILHPRGQLLAKQLGDFNLELPTGARVTQDHPRRGMVLRIPVGYDLRKLADWLILVGQTLAVVPLTATWEAKVFRA